jgi:hypothetical protein
METLKPRPIANGQLGLLATFRRRPQLVSADCGRCHLDDWWRWFWALITLARLGSYSDLSSGESKRPRLAWCLLYHRRLWIGVRPIVFVRLLDGLSHSLLAGARRSTPISPCGASLPSYGLPCFLSWPMAALEPGGVSMGAGGE